MMEGPTGPETTPAQPVPAATRRPRVLVLLAFLGVFLLLLISFRQVLFPFLMAIYIAYLVEPIVARVVRSRLLGLKWTRGPTIVAIYVLGLGGLAVLGWVGIAKLAKQVTETSASIAESLKETGRKATFELREPPPPETPEGETAPRKPATQERGILVPKDTRLQVAWSERKPDGTEIPRVTEFATLYTIRVTPEERKVSVLLEHAEGPPHKHVSSRPKGRGDTGAFLLDTTEDSEPATLRDIMGLRYADADEKVSLADAARVEIGAGQDATGLEYFVEREFISPIVENLATTGYEVEPTLLRDWVALQGEVLKEDLPERLGKGAVTVARSLVFSIYEFFLILMLTAFIVMDRRRIARFFASLPPARHRTAYDSLTKYIDDGLAGVIRGQLVICGVNGVFTYIGLLILGVPYALLLACLAAIFSLIPVFGTILSSVPIVLVATTDGINTGILALAWIVLIHVVEANVLNPVIMGSHARMHPVIIIFALLAGEHTFGIWGALLAVPTMSLVQSSFRFYLYEIEGLPKPPEDSGHGGLISSAWSFLKARVRPAPADGGTP